MSQPTGARDVVQGSPWSTVTNQHSWEENRVEVDVYIHQFRSQLLCSWPTVFTHELEQLDIVRVQPPFLPLIGICCGD